jgi:flagellar hook-associated protein FlgK
MISNSMHTAASGLIAQRSIVDTISRNIANASTAGYKRVDTTTQDLGAPFLGVATQSHADNQPWVDRNLKSATQELGAAVATQSGQEQAANILSMSDVGAAYSAFSAASMNMQQFPTSPQYQQEFSSATTRLNTAINNTQTQVADMQRSYQNRAALSQVELDSLKSELSKISSRGIDDTNSTTVEQLRALTSQLRSDITSAAGADIFADPTTPADYQAVNNSNQVTGFPDQLGALITQVGAAAGVGIIDVKDSTSKYNAASDAWQKTYGVDIESETVKLLQAQRLYEANAKVLQASDTMLGTLFNAIG